MAPHMAQRDWLASYAEVRSIRSSLDRIGERLTRGNGLLDSADELVAHYAPLESDFRTFLPDVTQFARRSFHRG
jgi:acyl carrier protein phosphodiesterase